MEGVSLTSLQSKVPKITRLFTPNLENFPERFTSTVLSVDDLVKHCTDMGLVKVASNNVSTTAPEGDRPTMAVQPAATRTMPASFASAIFPGAPGPSPAAAALKNATVALGSFGDIPYSSFFDPSTNFDISFDPLAGATELDDQGMFDAFDLDGFAYGAQQFPESEVHVDFGEFINEDTDSADII